MFPPTPPIPPCIIPRCGFYKLQTPGEHFTSQFPYCHLEGDDILASMNIFAYKSSWCQFWKFIKFSIFHSLCSHWNLSSPILDVYNRVWYKVKALEKSFPRIIWVKPILSVGTWAFFNSKHLKDLQNSKKSKNLKNLKSQKISNKLKQISNQIK